MDKKKLQMYITLFEKSSLSELEFSSSDFSIRMKKPVIGESVAPVAPNGSPPVAIEKQHVSSEHKIITSPIVGTFYRTPSPDSPPYVEVGDIVEKGAVVCTLEAMKLMNQLEAEYRCEIVAILVDQGSMVEFGQPLFEVKPL